jgi:glyoxylase-like metal-dependent hydrolase (beta-lactamase superfamily II)
VLPLEGTGQLDLVESAHAVTRDLTLVPAPGHTPAHACIGIVSGGERAMIIGDLAHHPVQLTETAWEMAFDMDKKLASETRERLAQRLEQEGGLTIGGHFPAPGFGRLVRLDGRRVWRAIS